MLAAAAQHGATVHGHEDTPEMREKLREFLEPESAYQSGDREKEPMPG